MQAEPALSYTCSEPRCYMYVCIYIYIYILICIYIYIYYILSGPNTRAEVLHKIGAVAQTEPELRASHLIWRHVQPWPRGHGTKYMFCTYKIYVFCAYHLIWRHVQPWPRGHGTCIYVLYLQNMCSVPTQYVFFANKVYVLYLQIMCSVLHLSAYSHKHTYIHVRCIHGFYTRLYWYASICYMHARYDTSNPHPPSSFLVHFVFPTTWQP
jgi:hypothetical protein